MDAGVVEIGNEADHAYASGYSGTHAVRTWHERMLLLEKLGFIKSKQIANQKYKLVLLVDPFEAVASLRKQQRVPDSWWESYSLRLMETKEAGLDRLEIIGAMDSTAKKKRGKEAA